jgi:hypothetical protein
MKIHVDVSGLVPELNFDKKNVSIRTVIWEAATDESPMHEEEEEGKYSKLLLSCLQN